MRRTVTVLQDDIDNGVRGNSLRCPVARAARRDLADLHFSGYFPGTVTVTVHSSSLAMNGYPVSIPRPATDFIDCFDRGRPVEPFKFEIEVPQ